MSAAHSLRLIARTIYITVQTRTFCLFRPRNFTCELFTFRMRMCSAQLFAMRYASDKSWPHYHNLFRERSIRIREVVPYYTSPSVICTHLVTLAEGAYFSLPLGKKIHLFSLPFYKKKLIFYTPSIPITCLQLFQSSNLTATIAFNNNR